MSKTDCYFCVAENDFSKEKFIRGSLVELYSAIDAPEGIDNVQFSDVFVDEAQLIKQRTYYDIDYTVEIGYDHEEQYIDKEEYYDRDLGKYLTRNVVKNRTVTDWQPYKDSEKDLSGVAMSFYKDGDDIDIGDKEETISKQYHNYNFNIEDILSEADTRLATEEEKKRFATPSKADHRDLALTSATNENFCGQVSLKLPGDRQRNFRANWEATNMFASVYAIERYKLTFDYEGHKCFIKQFATEKRPHIYCSYKHTDSIEEVIKAEEQNKLDTDPEYQKNLNIYKKGTIGSLCLGVISVALSQFLGMISFIGIVGAVVGFILSYKYGKKAETQGKAIKSEFKDKRDQHKTEIKNKKIELLQARLANMGMTPLTEEELERFTLKNSHELTANYSEPITPKEKTSLDEDDIDE